jgi:TusA-related sulfurtransferase
MPPEEAPTADLTVDTSGKFCPLPILEVARAVRGLQAGQVVQVIATDPGVEEDMAAWCKATRNELVAMLRQGKTFRAFVRRGSP